MLDVAVSRRVGSVTIEAAFRAGPGVTALFGRSGAGKTSIINMIAGLARPDGGSIRFDGTVLFDAAAGIDLPAHRRRIGYVFQDARLFPHLTVRRNLLYGAAASRRPDDIVDMLGLGPLMGRRPGALSGGERQRVALGRALLSEPRLLLMDEPLSGLDSARRAEILPYLEAIRDRADGPPILYVSHATDEVIRLADDIVLLDAGRVAAAGTVPDIFGRPDLFPLTGRFEAGVVIDAAVREQDAAFGLTLLSLGGQELVVPSLDLPVGTRVRLRLRARDVSLAPARVPGISIRNQLAGTISAIETDDSPFAAVTISLGPAALVASITRRSAEEMKLAPGMEVVALVKSLAVERRGIGQTAPVSSARG